VGGEVETSDKKICLDLVIGDDTYRNGQGKGLWRLYVSHRTLFHRVVPLKNLLQISAYGTYPIESEKHELFQL